MTTSLSERDTLAAAKVSRLGIYGNFALSVAKVVCGYSLDSKTLLADGMHAITDLSSDVVTLAAVQFSIIPISGGLHGKYVKLQSWALVAFCLPLLWSGAELGKGSIKSLWNYAVATKGDHLYTTHGSHYSTTPLQNQDQTQTPEALLASLTAGILTTASILLNEHLYRETIKITHETSSILVLTATHRRMDSFRSAVSLIGICASRLWISAQWIEAVGALLGSIIMIKAGCDTLLHAIIDIAAG